MIRRRIVLFISRKRKKIKILLSFILILFGIAFIASIIISTISMMDLYITSNYEDSTIREQQKTIIYGENIKEEEYISDEEIIDKFIQYCNKGKTKEAYELISEDCKEVYYSSEKEFKELYLEHIFYNQRIYELQSWISNKDNNTYKIKLMNDLFDRGEYNNSSFIEDYYTVITKDNERKISINKFIEKEEINKSKEDDGINIKVTEKEVYMEYEIYTIEVSNDSENDIYLDTKETTSATYLLDTNNVRYSSYIHELVENDLLIKSKQNKKINIKFNKMYNPDVEIASMEFNDISEENQTMNTSIKLQ